MPAVDLVASGAAVIGGGSLYVHTSGAWQPAGPTGPAGVSWWTAAGAPDPTNQADSGAYALGTRFSLFAPISVTAIRVFNPGVVNRPGRTAHLWNWDSATLVASVALPGQLPAGWSVHELASPAPLPVGVNWMVSYQVGGGAAGDYAAIVGGLNPDVSDGTVLGDRGAFSTDPANMPTMSLSDTFYGIDLLYVV